MKIDFDTDTPSAPTGAQRRNRDNIRELGRFELKGGKMVPVLADTIPPVEPPPPVALAQPKAHRVVAWRHDGGLRTTDHATLEAAREAADALSFVIYWKFMIMCGREMVARALIEEPR
jgi:hypothetical protein